MSDQTPSLAQLDPAKIHSAIANSFRQLAIYHDQLAGPILGTEAKPAAEAKPADKPAKPAKAKPAAKPTPPPEVEAEIANEMTPEEIAADLKSKLVALVGKDRAKAVSLLGTIGAKNFSTIPVEKHASMLRLIDAALNPKAADDDDPLA